MESGPAPAMLPAAGPLALGARTGEARLNF